MSVHERLLSQARVHFLNKLPNFIKSAAKLKAFETCLKFALISEDFYNTDDFMEQTVGTRIWLSIGKSGIVESLLIKILFLNAT